MAAELKNQNNWNSYGLEDLRRIDSKHTRPAPIEIKKSGSIEDAIKILANTFSLPDGKNHTYLETIIGRVTIQRENLKHIVEKRKDARERYANYALDTILNPFEVWKTQYDNGDIRYAFISLYDAKRQMFVVVSIWDDNVLWNFMHTDKKSLNKHRNGTLVYQSLETQKAANY